MQGLGVDNIELYVMTTELEVGADEGCKFLLVLFAFQQLGHEAYVQQRTATFGLVESSQRLDDGRRTVGVAAVCRRRAVADGEVGHSSVRRGSADASEVVVAGRRQHVQLCLAASGVRPAFDGAYQVVVDTYGNIVGIGVVVAEERCVVADVLAHLLLALPVRGTGLQQLVHRVAAVFEDVLLQRSKAVGDGA